MSTSNVRLIAADMGEGEQTREVCPFCEGGSKGEKSLNVTIKDGLTLYNCHRASCGEAGAIGSGPRMVRTSREPRQSRIVPYSGELEYLNDEWRSFLEKKIGWTQEHLDIGRPMYAHEDHRIAYPIFSALGRRRGWVLRSYEPYEKLKALTRMDVAEPHLSFYRPHSSRALMIVEDIPSAVRVARYMDSVALCGSGCSLYYASEMAAHYRHVVWALDADATAWSLALMRKHAMVFDSSRVLVLEKDFKDQSEEELCTNVEEYR